MSDKLSVDEILHIKEPADRVPFELSSDGRWLAFTLNGISNENNPPGVSMVVEGNSQWVCDLFTGESFSLTPVNVSSWSGIWSPDGNKLAFFSDLDGAARLWIWCATTRTLKCVSREIVRPFFGFEKPIWTPDGQKIIVKSMPPEGVTDLDFSSSDSSIQAITSKVVVHSTKKEIQVNNNQHNWIERYRGDILLVDINSGSSVALCTGLRPVGLRISNDGKYLAFTHCIGQETIDSQQMIYDLYVCSIDGGSNEIRRVVSNVRMEYGLTFIWGNDNNSIYYTNYGSKTEGELWSTNILYPDTPIRLVAVTGFGRSYDSPLPLDNGDLILVANGSLWLYSGTEKSIVKIAQNINRDVISVMPLTKKAKDSVVIQTVNKSNETYGFWSVNLKTNDTKKLFEEPRRHLPWFEGGATMVEDKLVYIAQSADEPPSIRTFNTKTNENTLFELSRISKSKLGSSQLLTWTKDAKKRRGALLLPPDMNGSVPVIVRVYGGAEQSKKLRFFGFSDSNVDNHQLFASQGYAVYLPDLPMARTHEPSKEIAEVLEDALHELFRHPDIDVNRIGIIGHSFGGYSALAAITQLPYFKAAVVSAGITSLISFYTHFNAEAPDFRFGWTEDGQGDMGVTLWQDQDRYIRNSPLFHFNKIEAPILIIQGTRDSLCFSEAGPMFSALRRLNKTAELVLYDEDHWQGTWRKENITDYYERTFSWFRRFL